MAIDALFERSDFHDAVEIERLRLRDVALNGEGPRGGDEVLSVLGGVAFTGSEFVVVVVAGDGFERSHRLGGAERAFCNSAELGSGMSRRGKKGRA